MTAKIREIVIHEVDLKKLMENKGLTIAKLSELTGIHFTQINKYRTGYTAMRPETWDKIKKYL